MSLNFIMAEWLGHYYRLEFPVVNISGCDQSGISPIKKAHPKRNAWDSEEQRLRSILCFTFTGLPLGRRDIRPLCFCLPHAGRRPPLIEVPHRVGWCKVNQNVLGWWDSFNWKYKKIECSSFLSCVRKYKMPISYFRKLGSKISSGYADGKTIRYCSMFWLCFRFRICYFRFFWNTNAEVYKYRKAQLVKVFQWSK